MSRSRSVNLRKRPRISYYEPEEPNLDEYVFCTDCADFVFEYCSIHGPLLVIPDDKVPAKHSVPAIVPRAALTIPHVFLHLARSRIPGAGIGVFTTLTLPRGVRFGPYRGQRTEEINSMYCWQIYGNDNRASHVIDAGDPRRSNWMRYVNCSRHWFEQNLIAYQYRGQIYYRTTRIIPRFTELLVFYGSEFANRLGVDLKTYNAPPSFAGKLGTQLKKTAQVQNKLVPPPVKQQHRNGLEEPKDKVTSKNAVLRKSNTTAKKQHIEKPKDLIKKQASNQSSMKRYGKTLSKTVIKNNSDTTIDETSQTIKSVSNVKLNNNLASVKDSSLDKAQETNIEINRNNLTSFEDSAVSKTAETVHPVNEMQVNNNIFLSAKHIAVDKSSETAKSDKTFKINTISLTSVKTVQSANDPKLNINNFVTNSNMNKVDKNVVCKILHCEICPFETGSENQLNSHLRAHAANKSFNCDKCYYKTVYSDHLKQHNRIHTGEKPYSCTVCSKAFTHQISLKRHLKIHTGEKPHSCTVCSKAFTRQINLKRHWRTHTGEKPYSCTVCSKAFTQQSSLIRHLKIHTGEKPYSCTVCSKAFTGQSDLKKHLRLHTGEKPYSCTVCSKAFTQQSNLKTHLRIHTGEKPYSCTVCSKAFTFQSNLIQHLRIHTGEKPYCCTVCSKAFTYQSNLKKHLRLHTGEKPYSCTVCSKAKRLLVK